MVLNHVHRSTDLVNTFRKTIITKKLIKGTEQLLLSISGGQDSICLLFFMNQLSTQMDLRFGLIWCHHLWQIDSFSLMREMTKISFLFQFDGSFALTPKFVPSELLARNWRHSCSSRIGLFYNYSKILLAHSANDKVETILLNLFRGTGMAGLSPLPLRSKALITKEGQTFQFSVIPMFLFSCSPFLLSLLNMHGWLLAPCSPVGSHKIQDAKKKFCSLCIFWLCVRSKKQTKETRGKVLPNVSSEDLFTCFVRSNSWFSTGKQVAYSKQLPCACCAKQAQQGEAFSFKKPSLPLRGQEAKKEVLDEDKEITNCFALLCTPNTVFRQSRANLVKENRKENWFATTSTLAELNGKRKECLELAIREGKESSDIALRDWKLSLEGWLRVNGERRSFFFFTAEQLAYGQLFGKLLQLKYFWKTFYVTLTPKMTTFFAFTFETPFFSAYVFIKSVKYLHQISPLFLLSFFNNKFRFLGFHSRTISKKKNQLPWFSEKLFFRKQKKILVINTHSLTLCKVNLLKNTGILQSKIVNNFNLTIEMNRSLIVKGEERKKCSTRSWFYETFTLHVRSTKKLEGATSAQVLIEQKSGISKKENYLQSLITKSKHSLEDSLPSYGRFAKGTTKSQSFVQNKSNKWSDLSETIEDCSLSSVQFSAIKSLNFQSKTQNLLQKAKRLDYHSENCSAPMPKENTAINSCKTENPGQIKNWFLFASFTFFKACYTSLEQMQNQQYALHAQQEAKEKAFFGLEKTVKSSTFFHSPSSLRAVPLAKHPQEGKEPCKEPTILQDACFVDLANTNVATKCSKDINFFLFWNYQYFKLKRKKLRTLPWKKRNILFFFAYKQLKINVPQDTFLLNFIK